MKKKFSFINTRFIIPISLLLFGIYSSILIHFSLAGKKYDFDYHLSSLASQFLKLNLWLSPYNVPKGDYVNYFGNLYLYFGPLPSVVLTPFVYIFGKDFPQMIIGIVSFVITFVAVYYLSRKLKFDSVDSLWLSLFFTFSTVLFGVSIINITAYQIQALGIAFIMLAIAEYFGKRRYVLIGIFLACAGLTRMTLYASLVFFLFDFLRRKMTWRQVIYLLVPVLISFVLLGTYNYKRFHSVFETGYKYNVTLNNYPMSSNLKHGFLSTAHIPANLYSFLFMAPEPVLASGGGFVLKFPYLKVNPWGLAIWFTSPLFLYFFIKPRLARYSYAAITATILLLIPSILYFGIGFSQFGYRYALDFLPFVFLLLLPSFNGKLPIFAKVLITAGILFNCLYLASLWEIYPHFNIYS